MIFKSFKDKGQGHTANAFESTYLKMGTSDIFTYSNCLIMK